MIWTKSCHGFHSAAFTRGVTLIRVKTDFSFYEHRFVTWFYVITFYYSRRASMRRLLYNFVRIPRFNWQPTTLWCRLECITVPRMVYDQLDSALNECRYFVSCAARRRIMQHFLYQPLNAPDEDTACLRAMQFNIKF